MDGLAKLRPLPHEDDSIASAAASEREVRSHRLVKATLTNARMGEETATIRNISEHGMGGRTRGELRRGEVVTISSHNGTRYDAVVCWYRGGNFGLHIAEKVDLEAFLFSGEGWERDVIKTREPDFVRTCYSPPEKIYRPGFRSRSSG